MHLLILFVVSAVTLGLEVLLPRVFSVIASILARDYGMFLVAGLGILSYLFVAAVSSVGIAVAPMVSGRERGTGVMEQIES